MRFTKRTVAIVAAATIAGAGLASSASAADTDHDVRAADFDAARTITVGTPTVDFLKEGIHLGAPDGDSYAIGVFATNIALADVHQAVGKWDGTDSRPSVKLNLDVDGDGAVDCQLQVERAYGDDMAYLNRDTQGFRSTTNEKGSQLPNDYCRDNGPATTGDPGVASLDDWATSLGAGTKVIQAGYGVLSGGKGDGVLESITLGTDRYTFTDEAAATPPAAPVTHDTQSTYTVSMPSHGLILHFTADSLPSGQYQGNTVKWVVTVNGQRTFRIDQGSGRDGYYKFFGSTSTAKNDVVKIYKDTDITGTPVQTIVVR